jgi:hypothetical protein
MYITGVNPGWVNSIAVALTAPCRRVERVTISESADCSHYASLETWLAHGISQPTSTPAMIENTRKSLLPFGDTIRRMAEALEIELDELKFHAEHATASQAVDLGWLRIEKDTIAAVRATWSGIAMHSGQLPGYAASHGCVRLPYDFSQQLFATTSSGGTVIVGDGKTPVPRLASNPGLLLAPTDFKPEMLRKLNKNDYDWHPERSPEGPITIVISSTDHAMYVYRNGNPIGRAAVEVVRRGFGSGDKLGNHVFTMLEGTTGKPSRFTAKHEEARWMRVTSQGRPVDPEALASRLQFSPDFADKLANELRPGTTVIVTDEQVVRKPKSDTGYFAAN